MANVTAAMVKELRERTGAGMMDCKKALTAADGNIELAIENMRKNGQAKAAKKAGRVAAQGVVIAKSEGNKAVLVEVNCETDFVAKDQGFLAFADKAAELALANNIESVEELNALDYGTGETVEVTLKNLIAKIGENMKVRRIKIASAPNLGVYIHSNRLIGVLVSLTAGTQELAKDVAMHICASDPQFVKPEDVSDEVVAKERAIQVELAVKSGKPQAIAEKMVEGRMKKFTGEVSLTGQPFVKDPTKTVGDILAEGGADVTAFTRFKVGEGIEVQQVDFAEEVKAQVAAAQAQK